MTRQIKILEIFSGIGSATQALKNIGFKVHSVPIENDKNINIIFDLIHNNESIKYMQYINKFPKRELDIKKINGNNILFNNNMFDIAIIGFPCQDISIAGKQKGLIEGTKSNLLWEALRLIKEMKYKPRFLLFENVKAFSDKKFENDRKQLFYELEELGYYCHNEMILNAKNFGIPQNHERWFLITENNCEEYKNSCIVENLDCFLFPKEMKPLKDFLEDIPIEQWKPISIYKEFSNFIVIPRAKDNELINGSYNRLWKTDEHVGTFNITNPIKITFNKNSAFYRKYKIDKEIGSLRVSGRVGITDDKYEYYRNLTPRECGYLMGWSDKQIDKVIHLPKSHLYKAFGNAIVIPVLEEIFKILFK